MELMSLLHDVARIPLFLMLFWFVGNLLYSGAFCHFENRFVQNYLAILSGFLLFTVGYAVAVSTGKSVLLLFVPFLVWQYFLLKGRVSLKALTVRTEDFICLGSLLAVFLLFFGVQLYRFEFFNHEYVKIAMADYGYYSSIAQHMNLNGLEQYPNWFAYFNKGAVQYSSHPTPYHYFELWTHAWLLRFSQSAGVFNFVYIFIPFINMLIAGAMASLAIEYVGPRSPGRTVTWIVVGALFVFYMGVLPFKSGGYEENAIYYPRVFMFYLLVIQFVLLLRKGQLQSASMSLAMVAFINILYVPSIVATLGLLALVQFFIRKQQKAALFSIMLALISALLIFLFYFVIYRSEGAISVKWPDAGNIKEYLFHGIHFFIRLQLARIWFFCLPLTLFVSYYLFGLSRKDWKQLWWNDFILVPIFLYFVSLFMASFFPHLESGTFNSMIATPLVGIGSLLAFCYIFKQSNNWKCVVISFLLVGQAVYSFSYVIFGFGSFSYTGFCVSRAFAESIQQLPIKNSVGGYINNTSIAKQSMFSNSPLLSPLTGLMNLRGNGYSQVSLSVPLKESEVTFEDLKPYVKHSPLYKFSSSLSALRPPVERVSMELAFIREYKLGYIILSPGVTVPNYLVPLIRTSVIDPYSKITIIVLL
jgi:hypothetical protein